jgi:hypothetical protein
MPGLALLCSLLSIREVSTVQYSVSVTVEGVVFAEILRRLLDRLVIGVRATSAYDCWALDWSPAKDTVAFAS